MRKFIQTLLKKTECICHTGATYQFVTDFEKLKFKEFFCLFDTNDNALVEYCNSLDPKTYLVPAEIKEVIAETKRIGIPFFYAEIRNKRITGTNTPLAIMINEVENFKAKRSVDENLENNQ